MAMSLGWYRLWGIAMLCFLIFASFSALGTKDASPEWATCVPTTTVTKYDESLIRSPSRSEIEAAKAELVGNVEFSGLPGSEIDEIAFWSAKNRIDATARYNECVSIGRLFEHLWWAIIATIMLVGITLAGRWIVQGFRKPNT